jgi:homoserine kinase
MDNVAASAFGGFNIVTRTPMNQNAEITTIAPPEDLGIVLMIPNIHKPSTQAARGFLPSMVSRENYVQSISYASRLSAAFAHNDVDALLDTLPWDGVIEPARAAAGVYGKGVDPKFLHEEKRLLLKEFHVAETISGAGPARALWYSISEDQEGRRNGGEGLIKPAVELVTSRFERLGHTVRETLITRPSAKGATGLYYTR